MATTVSVSEETRERLMRLKLDEGARSVDELLDRMIVEFRKARFARASDRFRDRLAEKDLALDDVMG